MSIIPDQNFKQFLSTEINLSSNVLTDRLGTINRFNLFSRLAHRSELDSRNICKNIEKHIKTISLTEQEKQMALKNLNAMKNKFCSSADVAKGQDCSTTIQSIESYLNQKSVANLNTQSKASKKSTTYKSTTSALPNSEKQPTQQPVKQQTPTKTQQDDSKTIKQLSAQNREKFRAQQTIVNAISRDTRSQGSVTTKTKTHAPNTERIKKIEKDLSEALRKEAGDYVKMIHYPWDKECPYKYVALRKTIKNGFEVIERVLVPALTINKIVKENANNGSFDVGALLREKRKEMGLKEIPIETK